jgi:hypothetical protein
MRGELVLRSVNGEPGDDDGDWVSWFDFEVPAGLEEE